jgi:hypothetical protein
LAAFHFSFFYAAFLRPDEKQKLPRTLVIEN